jgi:HlyD family secretion protein
VAVVGLGLLSALGWVATRSGPLAPIPVTVTPVVREDIAPALFGIGTVEARRAYVIGPTAAGRVRRVLVDVGDTVTRLEADPGGRNSSAATCGWSLR